MEEVRFDSAFMFKYSEREGTLAAKKMPDDVPEAIKGERLQQIIKLQERISGEVNAQCVGNTYSVLVEGPSRRKSPDGSERYYGRSPQNKTVIFPQPAATNSLVKVFVESNTSHTLLGNIIT